MPLFSRKGIVSPAFPLEEKFSLAAGRLAHAGIKGNIRHFLDERSYIDSVH
jgi:hypothetical protein